MFGILGGIGPHPEDVAHMKRTADRLFGDHYHWSVLGAGRNQLPIATQSVALGGNVRVGPGGFALDRRRPPGREQRRSRCAPCARSSKASGLEVASADEAREMLQLKGRGAVNF